MLLEAIVTAVRASREIASFYTTENILASLGYPDPLVARASTPE
jgi:hypothetical protein